MAALDAVSTRQPSSRSTAIVVPIRDDWASFEELVVRVDTVLRDRGIRADVLVVDDASTVDAPLRAFADKRFDALERIEVLRLRTNLGHQRAIAVGLAFLEQERAHDVVVVMDGDGEDDPVDIPRLVDRLHEEGGRKIVFAERTRRSESIAFRISYALYRVAHRMLTGRGVRVGNFSAIPRGRLSSLVAVSALWNHYAAAVYQSRQPLCTIPTRRAHRLHGRSTMNAVALIAHGLRAISVQSEIVGVRLLLVAIAVAVLATLGVLATVLVRFLTDLAIPGWATYTAGILVMILAQAMLSATIFSFTILSGREGTTFLPLRDYRYYVADVTSLSGPSSRSKSEARAL